MANDDYLSLLDRAKTQLPETIEKHERFVVPEPDVFQEGKTTVFRNFGDVVDTLRREPEQILQYLLRELGTPGTMEGRRVVFKTRLTPQQIADKIQNYVDTFVLCSECGRPDTHINKEDRVLIFECEAAVRTARERPKGPEASEEGLREGGRDLRDDDRGRRQEGRRGRAHVRLHHLRPRTVKGSLVKVKWPRSPARCLRQRVRWSDQAK